MMNLRAFFGYTVNLVSQSWRYLIAIVEKVNVIRLAVISCIKCNNEEGLKAGELSEVTIDTKISTSRFLNKPVLPFTHFISPYLFVLRSRLVPPWDKNLHGNSYWGFWNKADTNSSKCCQWPKKVCLALSWRFHIENILLCFLIVILPFLFFVCVELWLPAIMFGMLPLAIWTIYIRVFWRTDVLSTVMASTPPLYRVWVDKIINVPESMSPVCWSNGSADESLLRLAMFETFSYQQSMVANKWRVYRMLLLFAAPMYLSLSGLFTQSLYFVYIYGPIFSSFSRALSIAIVIWGVIGYFYFRLQSKRITDYLGSMNEEQIIPGVNQHFRPIPPNLSDKLIQLGIPTGIGLIVGVGLSLIANLSVK